MKDTRRAPWPFVPPALLALLLLLAHHAIALSPVYLHVETNNGNSICRVGVPCTLVFFADSVEGHSIGGFDWPLVWTFSNGNMIGSLREGIEVHFSAKALAVFEQISWDSARGATATDPDTTAAGFVDYGGSPIWDSSGELWRVVFVPTDTGAVTIDSTNLLPSLHLLVFNSLGNVPFQWQPRTLAVRRLCAVNVTGDLNADGLHTASDLVYFVQYLFKSGAKPIPCEAVADVNCDGRSTTSDLIALIAYLFRSGTAPCDVCELIDQGIWTCP